MKVIKLTVLEDNYKSFQDAYRSFENFKYTQFKNSSICQSSNSLVNQMAQRLSQKYDDLLKGYQNISNWWSDYIHDVKATENVISQNHFSFSDASIATFVNGKFSPLEARKMNLSDLFSFNQKEDSFLVSQKIGGSLLARKSFLHQEEKNTFQKYLNGEELTAREVDRISGTLDHLYDNELNNTRALYTDAFSRYQGLCTFFEKISGEELNIEKIQELKKDAYKEAQGIVTQYKNELDFMSDDYFRNIGIRKEEFRNKSVEELSALLLERDPSIGGVYKRYDRIFQNTDYGSLDNFLKQYREAQEEYQNLELEKSNLEFQAKGLSYSLMHQTADYTNFEVPEISSKEISKFAYFVERHDNPGMQDFVVDYGKFSKENSSIDPLTFTIEAIQRYGEDITIKGVENGELLKELALLKSEDNYFDMVKYYQFSYQTFGKDKANEYLSSYEGEIHQFCGEVKAKEFLDHLTSLDDEHRLSAITNHLQITGKGLSEGVQGFFINLDYALEGLVAPITKENRTTSAREYENMYIAQALMNENKKEQNGLVTRNIDGEVVSTSDIIDFTKDYGALTEHNFNISESIGNMLPSMLISAVNPFVGSSMLGVSAGGGSYHSAMTEGYSWEQSLIYGALSGTSEVLMERAFGGIPLLSDTKVTSFKTLIQAMGKEFNEEFWQSYIDAAAGTVILNKDFDLMETFKEAVQSGIYGGITGGIMNGPSFVISSVNVHTIENQVRLGNVSSEEIVQSFHDLVLETRDMGYDEIIREYSSAAKNLVFSFIQAKRTNTGSSSLVESIVSNNLVEETLQNDIDDTFTNINPIPEVDFNQNINDTDANLNDVVEQIQQKEDIDDTFTNGEPVSIDENVSPEVNGNEEIFSDTMGAVPIGLLEDILFHETGFHQFLDFDHHSEYFGDFTKSEIISKLTDYIRSNQDITVDAIERYDQITNNQLHPFIQSIHSEANSQIEELNKTVTKFISSVEEGLQSGKTINSKIFDTLVSNYSSQIQSELSQTYHNIQEFFQLHPELKNQKINLFDLYNQVGEGIHGNFEIELISMLEVIRNLNKLQYNLYQTANSVSSSFEGIVNNYAEFNFNDSSYRIEYNINELLVQQYNTLFNTHADILTNNPSYAGLFLQLFNGEEVQENTLFDTLMHNYNQIMSLSNILGYDINYIQFWTRAFSIFCENNQSIQNYSTLSDVANMVCKINKKTPSWIAEEFSDPKQFIISKIPQMLMSEKADVELIDKILEYQRMSLHAPVSSIQYNEIYQLFSSYLTDNDLKILNNMKPITYSDLQLKAIQFYTKVAGPFLTAYLRQRTILFRGQVYYDGTDSDFIHRSLVNEYNRIINDPQYRDALTNIDQFQEVMQSIFRDTPLLDHDMTVYRTVDGLYSDGDRLASFDVGTSLNDKAYLSTSLQPGMFDSSNTHKNIVLEIQVPKGASVAYLEQFTGISNYNQQELLINNKYRMVVDGPMYSRDNMTILPVRLLLDSEMEEMGLNTPKMDKTYFNQNLYDGKIDLNSQTDLSQIVSTMKHTKIGEKFEKAMAYLKENHIYDTITVAEHGFEHVRDVAFFASYMAHQMGYSEKIQNIVMEAAKFHDAGRDASNHGESGAMVAQEYLSNDYSLEDLNLIQAAIEYHALKDSDYEFRRIVEKYNIRDPQLFKDISDILKDADALDRSRFPGNLNADYFRLNITKNMVQSSYQLQDLRGKGVIDAGIISGIYNENQLNEIRYLREKNIPEYLIYMHIQYANRRGSPVEITEQKIQELLGGNN